jgi:predicted ATPase
LLLDRWAQIREGGGQVLLLCGEAGIGKSRLVRALEEYVAQDASAWLGVCWCSPYSQNTAFDPIANLVQRDILRFTADDTPEDMRRKLEGWLVQYGLPLAETVPLFASQLSLDVDNRYPPLVHSADLQKQSFMEALLSIVLARATEQPMLLAFEDLHWADPSTLEFLALLVARVPTARIMVMLTFRPEFEAPWGTRSHITLPTLSRLGRDPSTVTSTAVNSRRPLPTPNKAWRCSTSTQNAPSYGVPNSRPQRHCGSCWAPASGCLAVPTELPDSYRLKST